MKAGPGIIENSWTKVASGLALLFEDKGYVDCGSDSQFDITEAITIEAWVKIPKESTDLRTIAGKGYTT